MYYNNCSRVPDICVQDACAACSMYVQCVAFSPVDRIDYLQHNDEKIISLTVYNILFNLLSLEKKINSFKQVTSFKFFVFKRETRETDKFIFKKKMRR